MSVRALTWSFNLVLQDMAAKSALHALADHADETGLCWPSIARVALFSGCSVNTARRAIQRLEALQIISSEQREGKSARYRLNFKWQPENPSQIGRGDEVDPSQPDTPPKVAPLPAWESTPPNVVLDPSHGGSRTIIEPPKEPSKKTERLLGEPDTPGELDRSPPRAAFNAYNDAARRHSRWPRAKVWTDQRRVALGKRLKEFGGLEGFLEALAKAEASRFVCDQMDAWSLDWMLKPANFAKLVEGNYDNRRTEPAAVTAGWNG